jgi:menaquinone-dependent protoporphyrinogen oxidase
MKPILVAYATNAGSTGEIAAAIAEELRRAGREAEVRRVEDVTSLEPYGAAVIGGPMILGWHRSAARFVKKHREALGRMPVAYFAAAMRLTRDAAVRREPPALWLDTELAAAPKNPGRLSPAERFTSVSHYLDPMLRAAAAVKPASVAIFSGKLELFRLKWFQALFVMVVVRAKPGDYRNWEFIREWGKDLGSALSKTP